MFCQWVLIGRSVAYGAIAVKKNVNSEYLESAVERLGKPNKIRVASGKAMEGQKGLITIAPHGVVQTDFAVCKKLLFNCWFGFHLGRKKSITFAA